jgi:hypothetical protein
MPASRTQQPPRSTRPRGTIGTGVANSGPSVTSVWCSPFLAAAVDAGGVELVDEVVVHDATEHRRRCGNVGADGDHHRAPAARGGELADERVGVVRPRGRTRDERHAHRGRLRLEHLAGKTVRARAPTVPAEQRQQGARPCARFDREIERERRVLAAAPRAHDLPTRPVQHSPSRYDVRLGRRAVAAT